MRSRPPTRAVLALALLGSLGAPLAAGVPPAAGPPSTGERGDPPAAERLVAGLRALRAPEPRTHEELLPELAAAAAEAPGELLEILRARRVPGLADEPVQRLSIYQEALALDALRALGRATVLARLAEWAPDALEADRRAVFVRVAGAVGTAGDLDRIAERALPPPLEELEERVAASWRAALTEILERDVSAVERLLLRWRALPEPLVGPLVEALGASGDPRGLRLCTEILARRPDLALLVLAQARLLAPSPWRDRDAELARLVRPYLDPLRDAHCRAAGLLLAELGDAESLPQLLELLASDRAGLRENAHWALRELTGLTLPSEAHLWREWYERELRWLDRRRRAVQVALGSRDVAVAAAALRELTEHRAFRHDLAADLEPVLAGPDPRLRALAARGLGELGSSWSVPALVDALGDGNVRVREAAREALVRLTGSDRGSELGDWSPLLLD